MTNVMVYCRAGSRGASRWPSESHRAVPVGDGGRESASWKSEGSHDYHNGTTNRTNTKTELKDRTRRPL
eukprot:1220210-Prymnesium_polylepis.2